MKKITVRAIQFFAFGAVVLLSQKSSAQITFQERLGAIVNSLQITPGGDYMLAGVYTSLAMNNYSFLCKMNPNGDTLWTKMLYNSTFDELKSICKTADSNYMSIGFTNDTSGSTQLLKTDQDGNVLWNKIIRKDDEGVNTGYSIHQTSDDGFIICGIRMTTGMTDADLFLLKLNSAGDTAWTKTYGGVYFDFGADAVETSDGGYIATGQTSSFGGVAVGLYLVKTDSQGTLMWSKEYQDVHNEAGSAVRQTHDGGYIIAGQRHTLDTINYADAFIIRTDSFGNIIWNKAIGGPGMDIAFDVELTNDSCYIIGGSTNKNGAYNYLLFKLNDLGDSLWTKSYSEEQYLYTIQQTNDDGFILGGTGVVVKTNHVGVTGCFEYNQDITISDPLTLQTSPPTVVKNVPTLFRYVSPNVINGTNLNPICSSVVSTDEYTTEPYGISIYPNPASSQFTIHDAQCTINEIQIFNMMGEILFSSAVNRDPDSYRECIVNCESFPPGIYFVTVTNNSGEKATKKVSIIH